MSAILEPMELNDQADATLTIQQMAQQSGLSEHTLRYYERIGLIAPVPRDGSSGHRRYAAETVAVVEALACLRGTGMPIEDMRDYLRLRKQGNAAEGEQKAIFAGLEQSLCREMEQMERRMRYVAGKVAYWQAIEDDDLVKAQALAAQNRAAARALMNTKESE